MDSIVEAQDDNLSHLTEVGAITQSSQSSGKLESIAVQKSNQNIIDESTRLIPEQPWVDEHRDFGDGGYRAAVFGFSDGLVTNLCLILGVQFALTTENPPLIETGFAGLLAGAFSMSIGEWISMRAQSEALEAELKTEESHLTKYWKQEMEHLTKILKKAGLVDATIDKVIRDLKKAPTKNVVNLHARLELGIDPEETGNATKAAFYSFIMFAIGALIPILPYFWLSYNLAWKVTLLCCALISFLVGLGLGSISKINKLWSSVRQVLVVLLAAASTLIINHYVSQLTTLSN